MYNQAIVEELEERLFVKPDAIVPIREFKYEKRGYEFILLEVAIKKSHSDYIVYINNNYVFYTKDLRGFTDKSQLIEGDTHKLNELLINKDAFLKPRERDFYIFNNVDTFLTKEFNLTKKEIRNYYKMSNSKVERKGVSFKIGTSKLTVERDMNDNEYMFTFFNENKRKTKESDWLNSESNLQREASKFIHSLYEKGELVKNFLYINEEYNPCTRLTKEDEVRVFNTLLGDFCTGTVKMTKEVTLSSLLEIIPEKREYLKMKTDEYVELCRIYESMVIDDKVKMLCKNNLENVALFLKEEELRLSKLEMKYAELSQVFLNERILDLRKNMEDEVSNV